MRAKIHTNIHRTFQTHYLSVCCKKNYDYLKKKQRYIIYEYKSMFNLYNTNYLNYTLFMVIISKLTLYVICAKVHIIIKTIIKNSIAFLIEKMFS